ncbi:MAG: thioredoxin family protein [Arenicellales bacterium]
MLLESPDVEIGWKAVGFKLKDAKGQRFSSEQLMGESGLLVAFICNHCPYVKAIVDRLVEDANVLEKEGFGVVAIMSNDYRKVPQDSPENMLEFASKHGFSFPYLIDEDQSVGKAYDAVCTPDFFGFNSAGELQYRGRLDDAKMGADSNRTPELLEAMRKIAQTGKGPAVQHASMGCSIKWT